MRSSNGYRRHRIFKQQQQQESEPKQEQEFESYSDEIDDHKHSQSSSYSLHKQSISCNEDEVDSNENNSALLSSSSSSSSLSSYLSNYVNVAPLPDFHGDSLTECPLRHVSRFLTVCRANNAISSAVLLRIFPVTLRSSASLWYDLYILPRPDLTWPEIQSSFVDFFLHPDSADAVRSALLCLKQSDDESVNMYYLRMQGMLRRWPENGLPEELLKGVFVDGLREDFQDWIIPQRPDTLEEAVQLAGNWERVAARKKNHEKMGKCGFCEGEGHEERECEVRKKLKELWIMKSDKEEMNLEGDQVKRGGFGRSGSSLRGRLGGQCLCWKHQCWRKRLERNGSIVSTHGREKDFAIANADQ